MRTMKAHRRFWQKTQNILGVVVIRAKRQVVNIAKKKKAKQAKEASTLPPPPKKHEIN